MHYVATVIAPFLDKHTGKRYQVGDEYLSTTMERLEELALLDPPRVAFEPKILEAPVINEFVDKYTRHCYRVGSVYRTNSLKRLKELALLTPPRVELPAQDESPASPESRDGTEGPVSGTGDMDDETTGGTGEDLGEGEDDVRPDGADPGVQVDGQGLDPSNLDRPLEELSYEELKVLAKAKGIKANQSREKLIAVLREG